MQKTKEVKSKPRQVADLWNVRSLDIRDSQLVFGKTPFAALERVLPGDSEVREVPVPEDAPVGSKAYSVVVPKTVYANRSPALNLVVEPVFAVC